MYGPCVFCFPGRTHSADAVARFQGTGKGASALEHGVEDGPRGVELVPDGLAHRWHVR